MSGTRFMAALAAVAFGAGLMVASPAAAKCDKACKQEFKSDFQTCRTACNALPAPAKKKDKKQCLKLFCKPAKASATKKCKKNAGTTENNCGSPSGAFIDASLE